jgi:hypothetical protein
MLLWSFLGNPTEMDWHDMISLFDMGGNTGLAESLFSSHREDYPEIEQASLSQLFQHKVHDNHGSLK